MIKLLLGILIVASLILVCSSTCFSASEADYHYYMSLGIRAFDKGFYDKAIWYFEQAHSLDPTKKTPSQYIKLIKRFSEGRLSIVEPDIPRQVSSPDSSAQVGLSLKEADVGRQFVVSPAMVKAKDAAIKPKNAETLTLDDGLWALQPNTDLEIIINKPYVLKGHNIKRFLSVSEGVLDVDRLDKDRISITTKIRGETFFHVWDDRGRWTFNVKGQLPMIQMDRQVQTFEATGKQSIDPFRVAYSNNWSAIYLGNSIPDMARTSLSFSQWVGTYGRTPYGYFDASMNFYKYAESTERIGERIGLSEGKIGPFEDFTIRGFDTEVYLSDLTVPGRSFRGAKLESYAFHHNLAYTVFQGHDRAQFLFVSPGLFNVNKTYIEGVSATLFPDDDHNYTVNVARGYGDYRDDFLKDKVFSAETEHKFNDFKIYGEVATDEDVYSEIVRTELRKTDSTLNVNFRDIHKDYVTLVNRPSDRGEVGGNIRYSLRGEKARFNTGLDVFRDRFLFNPDEPDTVNVNWSGSMNYSLSAASSLTTSAFAAYTPQLLSPYQSLTLTNLYSQRLPFFYGRSMSFSIGHTVQSNRYDNSPASEFDRNALMAGIRMPVLPDLNFYANYEYSFVNNILLDELTYPNVFTAGVDYSWRWIDPLSTRLSFRYRNEENTDQPFSFMSGEDSIRGSLGISYRPNRDFEVYLDGNIRSVWTENPDNAAFNDANVRLGFRTAWDTFFRWNPTGLFKGVVFNDANGNTILDPGENGLAGIGVKVGDKLIKTDAQGRYAAKIRAHKVRVALDIGSLPLGYVNSDGFSEDIMVQHLKVNVINFGLTSQSGIYGVVYVDVNQNGVMDKDDKFISKMKILLDGKDITYSDFEGTYSFDNIKPGLHTLELDVNSLPINYIPLIKLKNEIEVGEGITYVFNIPLKEKE